MAFDKTWEKIHEKNEWGKYPSEEVIRFVARNFYKLDREKCKILDFGCGTGNIVWYLAREGFDAYGFDGSETAINKAIKRLQEENLKASLSIQDGAAVFYKDDFFDGVIDSGCIVCNTSENIKILLKEIYRILKNGGKLYSTALFDVNTTGFGIGEMIEERTFRVSEGPISKGGMKHFFTEDEIIDLWTEAGFSNIKIDVVERTDNGKKDKVSYFMVEAQKL